MHLRILSVNMLQYGDWLLSVDTILISVTMSLTVLPERAEVSGVLIHHSGVHQIAAK